MVKSVVIIGVISLILIAVVGCYFILKSGQQEAGTTEAGKVISTINEFAGLLEKGKFSEAVQLMDMVDSEEADVQIAFWSDPANKMALEYYIASLKTATIKEESESYMIVETTIPTVGKDEFWMIKRGDEWKIS